ncbi:MAG TPA: DNA-formamidopyrimidine glycosylase family protein [Coleofasciculaceae cyanobacterium]
MPELPEVEVFKRFVDRHALHKAIQSCAVFNPKILEPGLEAVLASVVVGHCFVETERCGKHLFIRLDGQPTQWLILHFGMTGYLSWFKDKARIVNAYGDPARTDGHIRVQFDFADGGHLAFHEQRMFGKLGLIDDPADYIRANHLGPDALSIEREVFLSGLAQRKGQVKPVLMDQALVAGVGNVYADEILFQCRIHPARRIGDLFDAERDCLYEQMREVLLKTVAVDADRDRLPEGYLTHHRTKKGHCPRDHQPLNIQTIGGRTTYFCPQCQQ